MHFRTDRRAAVTHVSRRASSSSLLGRSTAVSGSALRCRQAANLRRCVSWQSRLVVKCGAHWICGHLPASVAVIPRAFQRCGQIPHIRSLGLRCCLSCLPRSCPIWIFVALFRYQSLVHIDARSHVWIVDTSRMLCQNSSTDRKCGIHVLLPFYSRIAL